MKLPLTGAEPVDLIMETYPMAGLWLNRQDVICVECGEVFWGSLQELCEIRKITDAKFERLLADFNAYLEEQGAVR